MGKQVKTPRFYVDIPTFLHATGQLGWDSFYGGSTLLYMNCANPYINETQENLQFRIGSPTTNKPKTSFPINFCALLNHNLASDTNPFTIPSYKGLIENDNVNTRLESLSGYESILNSTETESNLMYNGSTIFTFTELNDYWRGFGVYYASDVTPDNYQHQLGSLVVGKYFDCPYSPDLNLTMSRRFDGIKKQKTIGGKTLANIYYDGPTEWTMNGPNGTYKYPPFELDFADIATAYDNLDDPETTEVDESNLAEVKKDFNQISKSGIGRKGLRSWKLTFSYISESDMWIDNEVSNTLTSDNVTPNNNTPNPMLSDNSFNFVWNCTLGGTLPFIFTDDKDSNEPDRYAICNFRQNTLSVTQNGPNVYKLNVTIDEIA